MRKILTLAASLAAGFAFVSPGQAQTPPPGAIFDLAVVHPGVLTSYQQFSVNFIAATTNTTVSFAFREVPAFFAFDDVSVTLQGSSTNLLADPGFETATPGTLQPDGWFRFIQPVDVSAIGQVSSNAAPYGCPPNGAHSGSHFWCDGSVQGYDGLYQTLTTTVGQTYTISFFLGDNSNSGITNPTIDMLAYAGDALPGGTVPIDTAVPEPASMALLAGALAGFAAIRRRRR